MSVSPRVGGGVLSHEGNGLNGQETGTMLYAIAHSKSGITIVVSTPDIKTPPEVSVHQMVSHGTTMPDFSAHDLVFIEHVAHLDDLALRAANADACVFRIIYTDARKDVPACAISNADEIERYSPEMREYVDKARKIFTLSVDHRETAIVVDALSRDILRIKAFARARKVLLDMRGLVETHAIALETTGPSDAHEIILRGYETTAHSLQTEVRTLDAEIAKLLKIHPELEEMREKLRCPVPQMECILAEIVDPRRFKNEHAVAQCIDARRIKNNRPLRRAVLEWCTYLLQDTDSEWPAWMERQTAFQLYQILREQERLAQIVGVDVRLTPIPFYDRQIGNVKQIRDTDLKELTQHLAFVRENHADAWRYASDANEQAKKRAMKRMSQRVIRKLYRRWSALVRTQ